MTNRAESSEQLPVRPTLGSMAKRLEEVRQVLGQGPIREYAVRDDLRDWNRASRDNYFLLGAVAALQLGPDRIQNEGIILPSGVRIDPKEDLDVIVQDYAELLPRSRFGLTDHYMSKSIINKLRGQINADN